MKRILIISLVCFCFAFLLTICNGQTDETLKVRPPAQAGQFYPGSKQALAQTIERFLKNAKKIDVDGEIVGLWAPHAGYEFSGQVAANGYRLIQGRKYEAVIVIGPSHYIPLEGGSIGDWNAYSTPLGEAAVDTQLVQKIKSLTRLVSCVPSAHRYEHSVEVQIPFIQTLLPGVPVVPMVVGNLSYGACEEIARAIVRAVQGRKVLLVASSDMSHFPQYEDAYDVDLRVLDAVKTFDAKKILQLSSSIMHRGVPGLDCVLCGPSALVTVMLVSRKLQADEVRILPYVNSGDISGERNRVVGYGAAVFYKGEKKTSRGGEKMLDEIVFSDEEKKKLFTVARESIVCALKGEKSPDFSVEESNLLVRRGVFVTLMNQGRLRGCIGHFGADTPLHEIVSQMAVAAATQDYRFSYNPVTLEEMDEIDIKISVLSEMKKVDSIEEIEVGKHGIWIRQGGRGGTYLPEVATEMGWDRIEFIEHCCVEKAGLSRDAWKKGADIYIYSSQVLSEKDL